MPIMNHDMAKPAGRDCVLKVISPSMLLRRKGRKRFANLIEREINVLSGWIVNACKWHNSFRSANMDALSEDMCCKAINYLIDSWLWRESAKSTVSPSMMVLHRWCLCSCGCTGCCVSMTTRDVGSIIENAVRRWRGCCVGVSTAKPAEFLCTQVV